MMSLTYGLKNMNKIYDLSHIYSNCEYAYIHKINDINIVRRQRMIYIKYEKHDESVSNSIINESVKYFKNAIRIENITHMELYDECGFKPGTIWLLSVNAPTIEVLLRQHKFKEAYSLYNRIIKGNHVKMDATSFIESYGAMCHYIEHSFFKGALTSKKGILEHWRNSSPADNRRDMNIDVYFK